MQSMVTGQETDKYLLQVINLAQLVFMDIKMRHISFKLLVCSNSFNLMPNDKMITHLRKSHQSHSFVHIIWHPMKFSQRDF